jgi:hypothetical protein
VYAGSIFYRNHVLALHPAESQLRYRSRRVGQEALFVRGVHPGASNDLRAIARSDLVLVGLDEHVQRCRVNQSLLDEQRLERGDSKRYIRGNGTVVMIMV